MHLTVCKKNSLHLKISSAFQKQFKTQFSRERNFKNNQTTKQLNNFIWTNRKQVKFCFYLAIGLQLIVNFLIVELLDCFLKSAPRHLQFKVYKGKNKSQNAILNAMKWSSWGSEKE